MKLKQFLKSFFNEFIATMVSTYIGALIIIVFLFVASIGVMPVFLVDKYSNWWYFLFIITVPLAVTLMSRFFHFIEKKLHR